MSFDVSYNRGFVYDAHLLTSDQNGYGGVAYDGTTHVDFTDPSGIDIVSIYDQGYTPGSSASLSNFAFNPSLAPVADTPEPPSGVLLATALAGLGVVWWLGRERETLAF